jgi:hypothetical protein
MRAYVPFETLWSMPAELPYSLLLRPGDYAWSCGQLALDEDSSVLAAGDPIAQSRIVCDYIEKILARGDVPISAVRRLRAGHRGPPCGNGQAGTFAFEPAL